MTPTIKIVRGTPVTIDVDLVDDEGRVQTDVDAGFSASLTVQDTLGVGPVAVLAGKASFSLSADDTDVAPKRYIGDVTVSSDDAGPFRTERFYLDVVAPILQQQV